MSKHRDLLLDLVLEDAEISLVEVGDKAPAIVEDSGVKDDEIDVALDAVLVVARRRLLCGPLLGGRPGVLGRRLLRNRAVAKPKSGRREQYKKGEEQGSKRKSTA